MKKPTVINLFGAPGAGKSTCAAQVFCALKKLGVNCELVAEFAKDKTWERNTKALSCQEYVFGRQSYRLARCRDDVDFIVTDSPLPLSIIFNSNPAIAKSFPSVVMDVFNTYNNINFFINRATPYDPTGRNQTEAESDHISARVQELCYEREIHYEVIDGNDEGYQYIVDRVIGLLQKDEAV